MGQTNSQRLRYLWWAGRKRFFQKPDLCCPACGYSQTRQVGSKYLVTTLWECPVCLLRFRSPKDGQETNHKYYQDEYSEGSTTTCPTEAQLTGLLASGFRGSECDFTRYIKILQASGLSKQQSVLDFGSSWGYGSWQLRESGFSVWSYEIGRNRSNYARAKLGCRTVDSLEELPTGVDCLFSAHVIEHLPDPALIWKIAATILNENGLIVCFCPNGNPELERIRGSRYYGCLWGKHHPMVITPAFLRGMCAKTGFEASIFSGPYGREYFGDISAKTSEPVINDELCMIARRVGKRQDSNAVRREVCTSDSNKH